MRMRWLAIWTVLVVFCGVLAMSSGNALAYKGKLCTGSVRINQQPRVDFPALAKVDPSQAIHKAESAFPGKVLQLALEDSNGFLVYAIEVVNPAQTAVAIVEVDAGTGTVLAVDRKPVKQNR